MKALEKSDAIRTRIVLREFEPGDEEAFRALNEEWIVRYFAIEPKDQATFDDPKTKILARGGRIFIAFADGLPAGCCALLAMGAGEYEVGKMAVTASCQGMGLGRRLLEHAVEVARTMGAARLYLETNHVLLPAIALYQSVGFRRIPAEKITPSPYARADVYMEMLLEPS